MVKISELKLPKIRKVIPFYGENGEEQIINIYNPTPETKSQMLEIIESSTDEFGELTINPYDMLIDVFPLFSDIEIDVDYIDDILESPTKEMVIINSEILSIINEINLETVMNQNTEYERMLILLEHMKGINIAAYLKDRAERYEVKNDFDPLNAEAKDRRNKIELDELQESYKKVQEIYEEVSAKSKLDEADVNV